MHWKTFTYGALAIALVLLVGVGFFLTGKAKPAAEITSFEECGAAGNPIQESYPEVCVTKDGKRFVHDVGNVVDKMNLITIEMPRPGDTITSPLTIKGQARGNWYFEASFPVELQDDAGNVLAQSPAQAQGDWMTTEFVPYEVTLTFSSPESGKGKLVLKKDNPSGDPAHDDVLTIPVKFK